MRTQFTARVIAFAFALFAFIESFSQIVVTIPNDPPGNLFDYAAPYSFREALSVVAPGQTITFNLSAANSRIQVASGTNWWEGALGLNKNNVIIDGANGGNPITVIGNADAEDIMYVGAFDVDWPLDGIQADEVPGNLTFRNLAFVGSVKTGLSIVGTQSPTGSINNITLDNVRFGVEWSGAANGNGDHGMYIENVNNVAISRVTASSNDKNGIQFQGVAGGSVTGSFFGTNPTGTTCMGNQWDGLHMINTSGVTVGGATAATRNILSCNGDGEPVGTANGKRGLYMQDAHDNTIIGNHIGTGVTGNETGMGNWTNGMLLTGNRATLGVGAGSYDNIIGGAGLLANVVGNNGRHPKNLTIPNSLSQHGIVIVEPNSQGNQLLGNFVGLGRNGTTNLKNKLNGIEIGKDAHDNIIGGTIAGQINYVANNGNIGIVVQSGADNNVIQNNYVGLNLAGNPAGNAAHGIQLSTYNPGDADYPTAIPIAGNQILNNVISANGVGGADVVPGTVGVGIHAGGDGPRIDGIIIKGNKIGVDINGNPTSAAYGNAGDGILIETELTGIQIGGVTASERNVVSNNGQHGINIAPVNGTFTGTNNVINGNYIGVASNGTTAAPNGIKLVNGNGINIQGSVEGLTIGGVTNADRNIIANNLNSGILLSANPGDATKIPSGINIYNNYVGFNSTGAVAGNATSGTGSGIGVANGTIVNIGGAAANTGNYISANGVANNDGVLIQAGTTINVFRNFIGTNTLGTAGGGAFSNKGHGVNVTGGTNVVIGGSGTGNVISGNTNNGVAISGGTTVRVDGNTIGLAQNGTTVIPNTQDGINVSGGTGVVIGTPGVGNIIAGNLQSGIEFNGSTNAALVQGNRIGVDALGASKANLQNGITLNSSSNVTIGGTAVNSGNTISGNTGDGIHLNASNTNTIQGNRIGVNVGGTAALANTGDGIEILGGSSNNIISSGNVISGNAAQGVRVQGATTLNNEIKGNTIGLNALGTASVPNGFNGVFVEAGASGTKIGGGLVADRNIISGNTQNGVASNGGTNTTIAGNYIGTDRTGSLDLGNILAGVSFVSSTNNTVGGLGLDSANVISGNNSYGMYLSTASTGNKVKGNTIGLNAAGTDSLGNFESGVLIDGSSNQLFEGNTISGNGHGKGVGTTPSGHGVLSTSSQNLTFYGNKIGTNKAGTAAFGNAYDGLNLANANGSIIGGIGAGQRNVISGNGGFDPNNGGQFCTGGQKVGDGIRVGNSANITIANNLIGLGVNNQALGNQENGIDFTAVTASTIGGATAAHRNVISSNIYKGIVLNGSNTNAISANLIGTDTTGMLNRGNGTGETGPWLWSTPACSPTFIGGAGILTIGSSNNTIGGAGALRNVVSGNTEGIWMQQGSNTNTIDNNLIGTDITGNTALPNKTYGVYLAENNTGNIIGTAALGNVISGNTGFGIRLTDFGTGNSGTIIEGNKIGLSLSGAALGNDSSGVWIDKLTTTTTIRNNTISDNGQHGVEIATAAAQTVTNNRIGTNIAGTTTIGNTLDGINISGSTSTVVTLNTIGGNTNGIQLVGGATTTDIRDNNIGTTATGTTNLANTNAGILITNGINTPIRTNRIAFSAGDGVIISGGTGNSVINNSLFCNDQTTVAGGTAPAANGTGITLSGGNNNFLNAQNMNTRRPLIQTSLNRMSIPLGASTSSIAGLVGSTVHIYSYDDHCQNCQPRTYTGTSVTITAAHLGAGAADTSVIIPIPGTINPNTNTYVVIITNAANNSSEVSGCSYIGCTPPAATFTTFPVTGDLVSDSLLVLCAGATAEGLVAKDSLGITEYIEWYTIDRLTKDTTITGTVGTAAFNYSAAIPAPGDTVGHVFLVYPDATKECFNVSDTLWVTSIPNLTVDIDADQVLCEDSSYTLVSDDVQNWSAYDWAVTTVGATGTLTKTANTLHPTYIAGDNDPATITIRLRATGLLPSRGAACGQIDSTMDITVHQKPTVDAGTATVNICPGSTLNLATIATPSSASIGSTIAWFDSIGTAASAGTFSAPTTIATSYTVAVQDSGQTIKLVVTATGNAVCPVATDFLNITVKDSTRLVLPITDTTICQNTTLDLSGIGAYNSKNDNTYLWSVAPNEGTITTTGIKTPTYTPAATPSASVVLTANVTGTAPTHGAGTCHQATDNITITINQVPTVDAGALPAQACSGAPINFLTVATTQPTATNQVSLAWTHDGTGSFTNATVLSPEYTPGTNESGTVTFTLTATGNGTCGTVTDNVSITLIVSPTVNAGSDTTICEGGSFNLANLVTVPDTSGGATSVAWTGGIAANFSSTTALRPIYTPTAAEFGTTVTLTLTASNGLGGTCGSVSDQMNIRINRQATVVDASNVAICEGDTVNLATLTTLPDTNYTAGINWSGSTAGEWITVSTVLRPKYVPTAADVTAGTATLTLNVTALPRCNNVSDVVTVTIGRKPTVTKPANQSICENGAVALTSTIANQGTITWSTSTGNGVFTTPSAASTSFTAASADYGSTIKVYVDVTAATTQCAAVRDSMELQIARLATVVDYTDAVLCTGDVLTLSSRAPSSPATTNAATIAWSGGTGTWTNPTAETATYTPATTESSVTLRIDVTSATPCVADFDVLTVTIGTAPTVDVVHQKECEGTVIPLVNMYTNAKNTTPSTTYTWTAATGLNTTAGTYTAQTPTGTNLTRTDSLTLTVTEPSSPAACRTRVFKVGVVSDKQPTLIINDGDMCVGDSYSIPATGINNSLGASSILTWAKVTGAGTMSGASYTSVMADGGNVIQLRATTIANGKCLAATDVADITVHALPIPIISGTNQVCANTSAIFNATPATSGSKFTWSSAPSKTITPSNFLSTGDRASVAFTGTGSVTLSVIMEDQFGCKNTDDHVVAMVPDFIPTIVVDKPKGCTGDNVTFNVTAVTPNAPNNTYTWYKNAVSPANQVQSGPGKTYTTNTLTATDVVIVKLTLDPTLTCVATGANPSPEVTSNPDIDTKPAKPTVVDVPKLCYPDPVITNADVSGQIMTWFVDGVAVSSGLNFNEVLTAGGYAVKYVVANGVCKDSSEIQVFVDDAEVIANATKQDIKEKQYSELSAKHNAPNFGGYDYVWTNISHPEQISGVNNQNNVKVYPDEKVTQYVVTATSKLNQCVAIDTVTITVFKFCEPENVFTPNGDGQNDFWIADCLNDGSFPEAVVTVYNRWGDIVYRNERGYITPWDGKRNGVPMPVATYWWIIEFNKLDEVRNGSVTILR